MKRLTFVCAAMLLLFSTLAVSAQQVTQINNATSLNMPGTYIMTKQTIDSGMGVQPMNIQQWKMYTDKYVMFAHRISESDSSAGFGIGTYTVENGKLIENMFFGEAGPVNGRYELSIKTHADGYSQVINFPGESKQYILSEDYKRSNRNIKSPLDGAWSLEKHTIINKDGTSNTTESSEDAKQFKIYDSGNFMWAAAVKDNTSGKWNSMYGYGTFEKNAPDEVTENVVSSTFGSALIGKPVKIKLKFADKNTYEQTIVWEDGSKTVEEYKRLQ